MQTKTKRILAVLLLSGAMVGLFGAVCSYANFGGGIDVIASDVKIIKTGIAGQKMIFSDSDFKQGLCITDFDKIKIVSLPSSADGTLMLAGRRVGEGMEIKRKNIGALVFIPASKDVTECKFIFTTNDFAYGAEVEFIIKFTEKVNYAPQINNDKSAETSLTTQRDVSVYGKMSASDTEGDDVKYIIVGYPKVGTLTIIDNSSGEYRYTPPADFTGTDVFSYVARDEWGNFSKLCKVEIEVNERMSEVVYADMKDHRDYNSAVILTSMNVMDGKLIGDGVYFMPESTVTRAEFVTMAMKCAGISADSSLTESFFDDNADIPSALMKYVATAQKKGIIQGSFKNGRLDFKPNEAITKYEAAVIISNILNVAPGEETPVFKDINTLPVWAKNDVYAMYNLGIFDYEGEEVNGLQALTKADAARYLHRMMECK